jgi:hypothetical protein
MTRNIDWLHFVSYALNVAGAAIFWLALHLLGAPVWAAIGFAVVAFVVWQTGDFVVRQLRKVQ